MASGSYCGWNGFLNPDISGGQWVSLWLVSDSRAFECFDAVEPIGTWLPSMGGLKSRSIEDKLRIGTCGSLLCLLFWSRIGRSILIYTVLGRKPSCKLLDDSTSPRELGPFFTRATCFFLA